MGRAGAFRDKRVASPRDSSVIAVITGITRPDFVDPLGDLNPVLNHFAHRFISPNSDAIELKATTAFSKLSFMLCASLL